MLSVLGSSCVVWIFVVFSVSCLMQVYLFTFDMKLDSSHLMGTYREDGPRLLCKVHRNQQVTKREILFRYRNFTMAVVKYWDRLPTEIVDTLFLETIKIHLEKPQIAQVSFEHLQPPVVQTRFKATSTAPSQTKLFYDSATDR